MEDVKVTKLINGPEAFTPDGEFCLGETGGARLLRRRRLLRARARRRGRDRQGDGRVDRRGRAVARRLAHGHPPLRRALPLAALHARPHARGLRDLLRHQVPEPRARGRAAAADVAGLPVARGARRGVRREVRLGAGQLVRRQRGGRRRVAAPARLGRACTGRPRSAPSTAPAARPPRCSTSPRSPSSRSPARARPSSSSGCAANRVAREIGKVTYTQMLNRRGGIECDFTVTRLEEDRFGIVTGTAFGNHDLAWIRSHLPAAGSADVRVADVTSQWACFALWGPRARDVLRRLHDRGPRERGVPVHDAAATIDVGDVPVRALRVTYVGELGWELYCPAEFGAALWRTLWEAGERARPRRRRLPRDRLAAAGEGLPRVGRGHHARRAPVPGRARLRGQARQGRVHRPRGAAASARRRHRAAALLPRARRPALGRALERAGADRRRRCSGA